MLYPAMNELLKKVGNRYLLVNLAAKRARDIAIDAEVNEIKLTEKPVKSALMDIMNDRIVLREDEPGENEDCATEMPAEDAAPLEA
mgnify:CR=1 FL=1